MKWYRPCEKTPLVNQKSGKSYDILLRLTGVAVLYHVGFYDSKTKEFKVNGGLVVRVSHWAYIQPPKRKEQ